MQQQQNPGGVNQNSINASINMHDSQDDTESSQTNQDDGFAADQP